MGTARDVKPAPVTVGVIVAHGTSAPRDRLIRLVRQTIADAATVLGDATARGWEFKLDEPMQLRSDERRHAGDFVGEASLRLVEGSFDLVVIVTDVPLVSRGERVVFGLASSLARTIVLSTHRLRDDIGCEADGRDANGVRWNASALLLHLVGRVLGLKAARSGSGAMAPFAYDAARGAAPHFEEDAVLRHAVARITKRELDVGNVLEELRAHLSSAARHPAQVLEALWRNRAPLLPLRMPGLATAAVAPVFVLVFSAEFWDAGLGMSHVTAWVYAAASILAAACYLCFAQGLFMPRKHSRELPEHLALANVVIFLSMLLAVIGLFAMVALLVLGLSLFVFPSDLIATWPTLGNQQVGFSDLLRIAVFISTVGVTTGALAGGMHRRQALRHIALFQAEV